MHSADALKSFREQWQRELRISPKHAVQSPSKKSQTLDNNALAHKKSEEEKLEDQKLEDVSIEIKVTLFFCIHIHVQLII